MRTVKAAAVQISPVLDSREGPDAAAYAPSKRNWLLITR